MTNQVPSEACPSDGRVEPRLKKRYKKYCEGFLKRHDGSRPVNYELWKRLHLEGLS